MAKTAKRVAHKKPANLSRAAAGLKRPNIEGYQVLRDDIPQKMYDGIFTRYDFPGTKPQVTRFGRRDAADKAIVRTLKDLGISTKEIARYNEFRDSYVIVPIFPE